MNQKTKDYLDCLGVTEDSFMSAASKAIDAEGLEMCYPMKMDNLETLGSTTEIIDWALNGGKQFGGGQFNTGAMYVIVDDDSIWSLEEYQLVDYYVQIVLDYKLSSKVQDALGM